MSWLANRSRGRAPRGFPTRSSSCGRQNFTWSFRTSSRSRYFRTWGQGEAGGGRVLADGPHPSPGTGINPRSTWSRGAPSPPPLLPNPPHAPPASSLDLVEKQGLADVAPAAGPSSSREQGRKQAHEEQGAAGGPGADEEHHEQAGRHPQQAGVPGEEIEGGAGGRQRRKSAQSARAARNHIITSAPAPNLPAWSQAFPPSSRCYSHPSSGDTDSCFSHRKLGAEAHSRLRQDKSTAA